MFIIITLVIASVLLTYFVSTLAVVLLVFAVAYLLHRFYSDEATIVR